MLSNGHAGLMWQALGGREEILAVQPELAALARRCGQPSMMDSLDYVLSTAEGSPSLLHGSSYGVISLSRVLAKMRSKIPRLFVGHGADGLEAAALLFEHRLCGVATGVYIPVNGDVYRTVLAPAEKMACVARELGEALLQNGGVIALISYLEDGSRALPASMDSSAGEFLETRHLVATNGRDSSCRLPLASSFEETLGAMGAHTRRNLRAYQRRAVKELGARYEARADVSLAEFLEMEARSRYPVPEGLARWRYETLQRVPGGSLSGLRAGDGSWLSLIGSHCQSDTVWFEWQVNREMTGSFSVVSAMRSVFIAEQVSLGKKWIHFEGGTPHAMRKAFVPEQARDLLFARRVFPVRWLKRMAPGISTIGPLASLLRAESLVWRE